MTINVRSRGEAAPTTGIALFWKYETTAQVGCVCARFVYIYTGEYSINTYEHKNECLLEKLIKMDEKIICIINNITIYLTKIKREKSKTLILFLQTL